MGVRGEQRKGRCVCVMGVEGEGVKAERGKDTVQSIEIVSYNDEWLKRETLNVG